MHLHKALKLFESLKQMHLLMRPLLVSANSEEVTKDPCKEVQRAAALEK